MTKVVIDGTDGGSATQGTGDAELERLVRGWRKEAGS